MSRKEEIKTKLTSLKPHFLQVTDESHLHSGHAGNPSGTRESHFKLEIAARQLEHLSKIEQHRLINNLLAEEFKQGMHALTIKIKT